MNLIAPGYFRTMGIPLIAGREFARGDTLKAPQVAIVNEAFAGSSTWDATQSGNGWATMVSPALTMKTSGLFATRSTAASGSQCRRYSRRQAGRIGQRIDFLRPNRNKS
jgi:hypothetical protein